MYNEDYDWPEFSFRNKRNCATAAGLPAKQWTAFLVVGLGEETICDVLGSKGCWVVVGKGELGGFKTRDEAARAVLDERFKAAEADLGDPRVRWDNPYIPLEYHDTLLDQETAEAIYTVLEEECNAPSNGVTGKEYFVLAMAKDPLKRLSELRFQGSLGFGGKIYFSSNSWSVGYYSEDRTPYRDLCVARANARLQQLYLDWYKKTIGVH